MQNNIATSPPNSEARRGQTLAEFAISLPLLLILLFGIIEFGRMFQSWVTIQNAARAAARYTITGQHDEARYSLDSIPCETTNPSSVRETYLAEVFLSDGFTVTDYENRFGATDFAAMFTVQNGKLYRRVDAYLQNSIVDPEDSEHLFETWYGIDDCFPDEESLQRRKDVLRLPSIYDVARVGAAGLSLDESQTNVRTGETPALALERFLFESFSNPAPRQEDQRWFNVVVCSVRSRLFGADFSEIPNNPDDPQSGTNDATLRYDTVYNDAFYPGGACVTEERIRSTSDATLLRNYKVSWQDAGAAGERVTLIVTYNHPLVTPLGLAPYVRMQAVRAAVNETFRVTSAERALGPSGVTGSDFVPPPNLPDTDTPTFTWTPLPTLAASNTPTATNTPLPGPFDCEKITLSPIAFVDNKVRVLIRNTNDTDTYLTGGVLYWDRNIVAPPPVVLRFMTIDTQIFWAGEDSVSPLDTRLADGTPANGTNYISASQPFWIFSDPTLQGDPNIYEAVFLGITALSSRYLGHEFEFSELFFDNPDTGVDCQVRFTVPPPPPTPTPAPDDFTPSPTFTPNCASSLLRIEFVEFAPNGDVTLRVVNNRSVEAPFRGFELRWPAWKASNLRLSKMVVGGSNANDTVDVGGTGTVVWQTSIGGGYRPSGVVIGNPNPPTITPSYDTSIGTWFDNGDTYFVAYVFPANSSTLLHIDFTGVGVSRLNSVGSPPVSPSDFNLSRFYIECDRSGWQGGPCTNPTGRCGPCTNPNGCSGGSYGAGELILDNLNTPVPTLPPLPTNTPGPSPTPSRTRTPSPPTLTPTLGPPTNTPTATLNIPTSTSTPTRTPTPITFGGADG